MVDLVVNLFKSNSVLAKLNIVVRPLALMLIIFPLLRIKNLLLLDWIIFPFFAIMIWELFLFRLSFNTIFLRVPSSSFEFVKIVKSSTVSMNFLGLISAGKKSIFELLI